MERIQDSKEFGNNSRHWCGFTSIYEFISCEHCDGSSTCEQHVKCASLILNSWVLSVCVCVYCIPLRKQNLAGLVCMNSLETLFMPFQTDEWYWKAPAHSLLGMCWQHTSTGGRPVNRATLSWIQMRWRQMSSLSNLRANTEKPPSRYQTQTSVGGCFNILTSSLSQWQFWPKTHRNKSFQSQSRSGC